MISRRKFTTQSAGFALAITVQPAILFAQTLSDGSNESLDTLVRAYVGTGTVSEARVKLAVAPLVDNGNSVPVEINVQSPMTATDHVIGIALFNEKNPQHNVAEFILGPRAGRAMVATRIRLSSTQKLVAVAKMNDGRCFTHTVEVLVTLAACIEE
jgi:sulfur-oxidizing protein SoxY